MHALIGVFTSLTALIAGALAIGTGWAAVIATIIVTAFVFLVPIAIYNALKIWGEDVVTWVLAKVTDMLPDAGITIDLQGLAAYLGDHLQVPEAIAILLSAVAIRFTIKAIFAAI